MVQSRATTLLILFMLGCRVAFAGLLGDDALSEVEERARTAPGREVRYETPTNDSYILVYVPSDYDEAHPVPVILSYHGYRGRPTTWPFRQATDGEGFLIVGMEYGSEEYGNRPRVENLTREIEHYRAVLDLIDDIYNIDKDRVFMGGFSQGGYSTTILGEKLLDELRGLAILGAARVYVDGQPPPLRKIKDMPVFVGCGELDETHYPRAQESVRVYERWEADVTYEWWEGVGHSFERSKSTELGAWLRKYAAYEEEPEPEPEAKAETKREINPIRVRIR